MAERINIQALADELAFRPEDVRRMVSMFLKSSDKALAALDEAAKNGDFEGVYTAAHSIKGSAGILRLNDLKAFAQELENAGRNRETIDYVAAAEMLRGRVEAIEVIYSTFAHKFQ